MAMGERLKAARWAAGLSQEALGRAAGVTKQSISKYEEGRSVPSSSVLSRLAQRLGVKVEFLLRPGFVPGVKVVEYRKHSRLGAKEQAAIVGKVQEWLERYLDAESLLPSGEARPFRVPSRLERHPASLEAVEDAAEAVRDGWRLGLDPIENLTETLEDGGVKVTLVEAPNWFSALAMQADAGGPVIAVNGGSPGDRQRFSLAHELGHILLEPSKELKEEPAMNRFAAAFIVPGAVARAELGKRRRALGLQELLSLKRKYGLSVWGWVSRARDLSIIPEQTARRYFGEFKSKGWYWNEPGDRFPREEPQRMRRLVMKLSAEEVVSDSRAAELLGESLTQFYRETIREPDGQSTTAGG